MPPLDQLNQRAVGFFPGHLGIRFVHAAPGELTAEMPVRAEFLAPNGYLHCATDWEEYAVQMLEVLSTEAQLTNMAKDFTPRPPYRPQTKFESRGLKLGHGVWDVVFRRT